MRRVQGGNSTELVKFLHEVTREPHPPSIRPEMGRNNYRRPRQGIEGNLVEKNQISRSLFTAPQHVSVQTDAGRNSLQESESNLNAKTTQARAYLRIPQTGIRVSSGGGHGGGDPSWMEVALRGRTILRNMVKIPVRRSQTFKRALRV